MKTVLTNRFGNVTDTRYEGTSSRRDFSIFVFGKYSPELVVELFHTYTNWAGGGGLAVTDASGKVLMNLGSGDVGINIPEPLEVCYTWKKFRDEYEARNVQF